MKKEEPKSLAPEKEITTTATTIIEEEEEDDEPKKGDAAALVSTDSAAAATDKFVAVVKEVQYEASADELYVRARDPPFLLSQPVMAMACSATAGRRASGKTESFVTAGGNSGLYG
uniref:Uncharacterized protein n=1 Tax=Oryza barthii TaxID=65489 RepID=A0A0D3HLD4_9ORYZ